MAKCIFFFGQTEVVEDSFHTVKTSERRDNDNNVMPTLRVWQQAVAQHVADDLHSFSEVSHKDIQLGADDPRRVPKGLFQLLRKKSSVNMRGVVSEKSKAGWTTFSPQSFQLQHCDMAAMIDLEASGAWEQWWLGGL